MLRAYLDFLEIADSGKAALTRCFGIRRFAKARSREKADFGKAMFELVTLLGKENDLMRWILV